MKIRTAFVDQNLLKVLPLATLLILDSGCTTLPETGNTAYDPIENTNRHIYSFNDTVDKNFIKPVADAYVSVTPQPVRTSVSNFFNNVGYINVILNDVLQGKAEQGISDSGRFVVNSTVGILGLFDPATSLGLPAHEEDFGQTLGVYGSGPGPYLVLPLLGPNTLRDSPGIAVSTVTNLLFYVSNAAVTIPLGVLGAIDARAKASSALSIVDEAALDPYLFIREAYLQRRTFLIYDGNPPPEALDDSEDGTVLAPDGGADSKVTPLK